MKNALGKIKRIESKKEMLARRLLLSGFILIIGYILWGFGFRDDFVIRNHQASLQKLAPSQVASITIGHQLIDNPAEINCIVTALKQTEILSSPAYAGRGPKLTLNEKNGHKSIFLVYRYQAHPEDAILQLDDIWGLRWAVKGLAISKRKAGNASCATPYHSDGAVVVWRRSGNDRALART